MNPGRGNKHVRLESMITPSIMVWGQGVSEPPELTDREKVIIEQVFEPDIYPEQLPRQTMLQPTDRVVIATLLCGLSDAVNSKLGVAMGAGQTHETREAYENAFAWVMSDDETEGSFLYLVDHVNRASGSDYDPEWMRRAVRRRIRNNEPVNLRAMHGIRHSTMRKRRHEECEE